MDFFKFKSATDPTTLDQGEHINGIDRSMWIERYSEPGEFSFEGRLSSGLKEFLPPGALISHVDTLEIMIVENHEIKETQDSDPTIIVTGRSFVSYLEQRVIGINLARNTVTMGNALRTYDLTADFTWNQAVKIINDHIRDTFNANDALVQVSSSTTVTGTGVSVARTIEHGNVWERVAELLKMEDLGIRTIRKNTFGLGTPGSTIIQIYRGTNLTSKVLFSWKAGTLSAADYLFTNKLDKNSALVVGQYIWTVVDLGPTKYDRRFIYVDATDIDGHLDPPPKEGTAAYNTALAAMNVRGQQALLGLNNISITQTDVSKTSRFLYRTHYNLGDLVSLDGNFGQIEVRRVTEYAEIEDENGESGHPTLAVPGV